MPPIQKVASGLKNTLQLALTKGDEQKGLAFQAQDTNRSSFITRGSGCRRQTLALHHHQAGCTERAPDNLIQQYQNPADSRGAPFTSNIYKNLEVLASVL